MRVELAAPPVLAWTKKYEEAMETQLEMLLHSGLESCLAHTLDVSNGERWFQEVPLVPMLTI